MSRRSCDVLNPTETSKRCFPRKSDVDRAKGLHKNLRTEILPLGGKRGSSSASAADWQEMLDRIHTRMVGILERDTGWKHRKNNCDI